jgi:hypothetical protein
VVLTSHQKLGFEYIWIIRKRLLSLAAGPRKSYWSGCIKAAIVMCQQIFSILTQEIFPLKFILKVLPNHVCFALAPTPLRVVLLCFAIQCLDIAL